jgi:hypothetical protein
MARTNGADDARRKALLDGMLFEIFFDSHAQLRIEPKNRCLDLVFDLQQYKELSDSFAFISEILLAYPDRFHAIPGKNREITVDVVTKKKAGNKHLIQKIIFEGNDILWKDDDVFGSLGSTSGYRQLSIMEFEKRLSDEMLVPARLLKVTYTFDRTSKPQLLFPYGGTVRKH